MNDILHLLRPITFYEHIIFHLLIVDRQLISFRVCCLNISDYAIDKQSTHECGPRF